MDINKKNSSNLLPNLPKWNGTSSLRQPIEWGLLLPQIANKTGPIPLKMPIKCCLLIEKGIKKYNQPTGRRYHFRHLDQDMGKLYNGKKINK